MTTGQGPGNRKDIMGRDTSIHVRVDQTVKAQAAEKLAAMGLTLSEAVRGFLGRVAEGEVQPHARKVSHATTRAAMTEARSLSAKVRDRIGAAESGPNMLAIGSDYKDFDGFVAFVAHATPMQMIELERHGINGRLLRDLARRTDIPLQRLFDLFGLPTKKTERRAAKGKLIAGCRAHGVLGMVRLVVKAQAIAANSTAVEAQNFDALKWMCRWLLTPQPALGGQKALELMDTPTGVDIVLRLLGAIESGGFP